MRSNLFDKIVLIIYAQIHVARNTHIVFFPARCNDNYYYLTQLSPSLRTPGIIDIILLGYLRIII